METYIEPKPLVDNPQYQSQRQMNLSGLRDDMIDYPIIDLIHTINQLPYCFTLQCCYGHFLYPGQDDPHNLEFLPHTDRIETVEYRIAYLALCIEHSVKGLNLYYELNQISSIDPKNIQFCSAEWFWRQQVNSYALQVEPERYKTEDKVIITYEEAVKIEKVRMRFFEHLTVLFQ